MIRLCTGHPGDAAGVRILPRAAILSFTLGMIALRVCWMPGVNCAVAAAALVLGVVALVQVLRARGTAAGLEEAIAGMVLGIVVLGLSVFVVSALVAAYR